MSEISSSSITRTLSMQPTQQCNAACEHCGTFSGPQVKVHLEKKLAEDAVRQAAAAGFKEVVFTGGEATLTGRWLYGAVEQAKLLGLRASLVTNGWWAKTAAAAAERIRRFVEAGLDEIRFSTGDQHVRFVPVECIARGVCAAVEADLGATVLVEIVKTRRITKAVLEAMPEIQAIRAAYPQRRLKVYESPWMPLDPAQVETYPQGIAANSHNLSRKSGCDDILGTITVGPDGTIGACCGIGMRMIPELQLGNIADTPLTEACAQADSDPLKQWIRSAGPERILAWAATHDRSIQWENMYGHRCQACIRMHTDEKVRRVLREHRAEMLADVSFRAGDRAGPVINSIDSIDG